MKKLKLIIVLMFLTIASFSQVATFKEVEANVAGKYEAYITKAGEMFKVGDTITIGKASNSLKYVYVASVALGSSYPLTDGDIPNKSAIIKNIAIRNSNLMVTTFKPAGMNIVSLGITQLEQAITAGEIKSKYPTSDEALQTLKKEKDKLDLGVITTEQYETKKAELIKYIK